MPFTDVSIEVGTKIFHAHKVVLIARSPVFRDLFTKNQQPQPIDSLKISNIQPEVFGELLRFLYTDQVKNLGQYAKDLLGAADEYMLDMLKRKCEKVLTHQVSMENCLELLLLADRHAVPKLKKIVLCCIQFHVTEIVQTCEWQQLKRSHPQLYGDTADALLMCSNW
jgi:speckle-type POZ protein